MSRYAAVITCRTSKGEKKTAATVYGSWAVHQSLDPRRSREWAITQVPTGYCIPAEHTELLTKKQAIEIAKAIDEAQGARKVTPACGGVIVQIITRIFHRDLQRRSAGQLQHEADIAEGCP